MQWWNDFVDWFNSTSGWRVFSTAILPFIAIVVAAVLAAWIGRASARRVLAHQDGELKAAAIMALIGAGRKAAIWSSLGVDEKQHVDSLISEADIRIRLLPVNGANAAADWAAHELGAMKKNSATFSFQAEQTFVDYRDRLLEWQDKPRRARKLFAFDLEQWRYDDDSVATTPNAVPGDAASSDAPTTDIAESTTTAPAAAIATGAIAGSAAGLASGELTESEALAAAPPPVVPPSTDAAPPVAMTTPVAETTATGEVQTAPAPVLETDSPYVSHVVEVPSDSDPSDTDDSDVVDDHASDGNGSEGYAPPITAGTVRRATGTETEEH
jgi:hypothetical protein